jgi:hypothetical protein
MVDTVTYQLSSARINPAQPVRNAIALVHVVTELRVILVDVKRE